MTRAAFFRKARESSARDRTAFPAEAWNLESLIARVRAPNMLEERAE
jgi:hypothetical protein